MFDNVAELRSRQILGKFFQNSFYFVLLSLFIGWLIPKMTYDGQKEAISLLLEHSAPLSFNLLGSWALFFIAIYVAILGTVSIPSKALLWIGLYPANVAFTYGSIVSGIVIGLSISGILFWNDKSSATVLFIRSLPILSLLFIFAISIKILCAGICKLSPTQHRILAGIFAISVLAVAYYEYKNFFI
ncbi:MAG TPA: hypothetical protein DEP99_05810 [Nitrospiraceae bacterium]|nr:hypothetical protein [Nitrospiraceae bacterium]